MDDILEITRLRETSVSATETTHRIYQGQGHWRSERWVKCENIGRGGYGTIWREKEMQSQSKRAL